MANTQSKRKVIWAVDPFASNRAVLRSAAANLRVLGKDGPIQVEPVYVWTWARSASEISFSLEGTGSVAGIQKFGQAEVNRAWVKSDRVEILPLRVISKPIATVREEARELIDYAKKANADMILISSHGRKGVERWFLGSFAETITLYSDVPLLIVHPDGKQDQTFKSILFPTDFSSESLAALDRILDFAKERKCRVTLFHKLTQTWPYPAFEPSFTAQAYAERLLRDDFAEHKILAKKIIERAKKQGVRVTAVFDQSKKTTAFQAILGQAKRTKSMIAMASCSGPIAAVGLGSLSRKVVRHAKQPVWILHPDTKKARVKSKSGASAAVNSLKFFTVLAFLSTMAWAEEGRMQTEAKTTAPGSVEVQVEPMGSVRPDYTGGLPTVPGSQMGVQVKLRRRAKTKAVPDVAPVSKGQ